MVVRSKRPVPYDWQRLQFVTDRMLLELVPLDWLLHHRMCLLRTQRQLREGLSKFSSQQHQNSRSISLLNIRNLLCLVEFFSQFSSVFVCPQVFYTSEHYDVLTDIDLFCCLSYSLKSFFLLAASERHCSKYHLQLGQLEGPLKDCAPVELKRNP